jgi:hypothetical protein
MFMWMSSEAEFRPFEILFSHLPSRFGSMFGSRAKLTAIRRASSLSAPADDIAAIGSGPTLREQPFLQLYVRNAEFLDGLLDGSRASSNR